VQVLRFVLLFLNVAVSIKLLEVMLVYAAIAGAWGRSNSTAYDHAVAAELATLVAILGLQVAGGFLVRSMVSETSMQWERPDLSTAVIIHVVVTLLALGGTIAVITSRAT
jgi:hypothetical protein